MKNLLRSLREFQRYPSAIAGMIIIFILVGIAAYALITIPYSKAITLWRGGEEIWYRNPKQVPPAWINLFRRDKLPVSFVMNSADGTAEKNVVTDAKGESVITLTYSIDYTYDTFPQEMMLYFETTFTAKEPYVTITWITPDGREILITNFAIGKTETYRFSQDTRLERKLGMAPIQGLFADPNSTTVVPLKGMYKIVVAGTTFEANSNIDAELVFHGKVSGLAGTDQKRRDLMVALLWGTPIALAFGLLAALGTTLTTMIISALGVWYGGWVDDVIQRITEVNMVLPFLPILIMIGTFYSRSIWMILGATILLSIFGGGIKTYRAVFMQVRESAYIEAARAYGASSGRIIFNYMVPRMIPMLIPQLVTLIPSYVFLEASLAVLGLGDPVLPTWGKIINDAQANGALYQGLYYWVLEPAALLMFTGLAFAMLGFSLDRIFNPRLRGM
jgi:peptide/nickel transport system permease protein